MVCPQEFKIDDGRGSYEKHSANLMESILTQLSLNKEIRGQAISRPTLLLFSSVKIRHMTDLNNTKYPVLHALKL